MVRLCEQCIIRTIHQYLLSIYNSNSNPKINDGKCAGGRLMPCTCHYGRKLRCVGGTIFVLCFQRKTFVTTAVVDNVTGNEVVQNTMLVITMGIIGHGKCHGICRGIVTAISVLIFMAIAAVEKPWKVNVGNISWQLSRQRTQNMYDTFSGILYIFGLKISGIVISFLSNHTNFQSNNWQKKTIFLP